MQDMKIGIEIESIQELADVMQRLLKQMRTTSFSDLFKFAVLLATLAIFIILIIFAVKV